MSKPISQVRAVNTAIVEPVFQKPEDKTDDNSANGKDAFNHRFDAELERARALIAVEPKSSFIFRYAPVSGAPKGWWKGCAEAVPERPVDNRPISTELYAVLMQYL